MFHSLKVLNKKAASDAFTNGKIKGTKKETSSEEGSKDKIERFDS